MIKNLLRNKTTQHGEIELTLFESCNMKCSFCTQDHTAMIGTSTEEIHAKIPIIQNFVNNDSLCEYNINIMGGEIFQDASMDDMIPVYLSFLYELSTFAVSSGTSFNVNFVTNLLFKNRDQVKQLLVDVDNLECMNSNLITSYDFAGRFNRVQFTDFKESIEYFKADIVNVSFVATKQSIQKALKDDDDYFKYLYDNFDLYFDYFVPDAATSHLMPSDSELLNFFKWLVDNYPKVEPVSDWINQKQNTMTCYSLHKITILPDNKVVKCRYKNYSANEFNNEIMPQSNDNLMMAYLDENECLSCEYFDRCGFRCFVQWDWVDRERDVVGCLYKQLHAHIDNVKQFAPISMPIIKSIKHMQSMATSAFGEENEND